MSSTRMCWALLLAGGEGTRLRGFAGQDGADDVPKQFRCLTGERSLLRCALRRARRHAPSTRIVPVVARRHHHHWERELSGIPAENILAQMEDRGTGVALLAGALLVLMRDPDPLIVSFPSDHAVGDERALASGVTKALRAAEANPDRVILIGLAEPCDDADYGWIMPGEGLPGRARAVQGFVEKPGQESADRLRSAGALVNTFILAARGRAMLRLFQKLHTELVNSFLSGLIDAGSGVVAIRRQYPHLPFVDFGRELLEPGTDSLAVVQAPACDWADLGTPGRVTRWLERFHSEPLLSVD